MTKHFGKGSPFADGGAVDMRYDAAKLGCTADEDVIRFKKHFFAKGAFLYGDMPVAAKRQQVVSGNAGKNMMIGRVRQKDAVFQYGDVGMCAFGDYTVANENCLVRAGLLCRVGCEHIGEQIHGFDMAQAVPHIRLCDDTDLLVGTRGRYALDGDQQAAFGVRCICVATSGRCTGYLYIKEKCTVGKIRSGCQKKTLDVIIRMWQGNVQCRGGVFQPLQMRRQVIDVAALTHQRIIHGISEEHTAVLQRNMYLFPRAKPPVCKGYTIHNIHRPFKKHFTKSTVCGTIMLFISSYSGRRSLMNMRVAIQPCDTYEYQTVREALEKAVQAVDGLSFVREGMTVALKVNLVSFLPPERAATTHPTVVSVLCDLLTERGAKVIIGDSPGGLYTPAFVGKVYTATGMRSCVRDGVVLNTDFSQKEAVFKDAKVAHRFTYTGYLDAADAVIDVCKFKTHGMMGFSCAAKNMFGTIPGTIKPEYHFRYPSYEAFADMIVDLNAYFKPVLSVCDAVFGMEGNGPTAGDARKIGCLLVSPCAHHLDLVAASLIGLGKERVPTLAAAYARGLIPARAQEVEIVGNYADFMICDYKNIATPHSLSFKGASNNVLGHMFGTVAKAALTSRPRVEKPLCIGCGVCQNICPVKAIIIKDGKACIDRGDCIRCFCCQEFCPKGAIKVHRTWIARLLTHA